MNRKKMKREHQDVTNTNSTTTNASECSSSKANKAMGCLPFEDEQESGGGGGGMDELLAVLGYKVRSSNMDDVAQRLEQLEMALGDANSGNQLCDDTVHYNPADLSAWVHSMLSEVNPTSDDIFNDTSDYDLRAIPGVAAFPPPPKRLRTSPELVLPEPPAAPPAVVLDAQEAGVRLVHTLMACAEAVQKNDMSLADAMLKRVGALAASQPGAMRKVANHFAEALARRIYSIRPQNDIFFSDKTASDLLHMHFYETCPYLKFAHFTANQAILEAFAGSTRVHVVDFGLRQGMQWPALMQALALRPGGPPAFRLTGIGPPQPDGSDALQQVGWKLAQLAETVGVEFEFRGFVAASLSDVEPKLLDLRAEETVAVNAVFELHGLLSRDGALERVTRAVRSMRPKIVMVVEQEADHNGGVFLDRFTEALHYYSTMFDSLEISPPSEDLLMTEVYLGKQICNVVACEGSDRVERHERLGRWRDRLSSSGFEPVHLGSNAFKQASMLLALFAGGEGYRVDENGGCLLLGWHSRHLIATSAWRVAESG